MSMRLSLAENEHFDLKNGASFHCWLLPESRKGRAGIAVALKFQDHLSPLWNGSRHWNLTDPVPHNQQIWGKASCKKKNWVTTRGHSAQPPPLPSGTENSVPRQCLPLGTGLQTLWAVPLWLVGNEWLSMWPSHRLEIPYWPLQQVSRPSLIIRTPPAVRWWVQLSSCYFSWPLYLEQCRSAL